MKRGAGILAVVFVLASFRVAAAASPDLAPALAAFARRDFKKVVVLTKPLADKGDAEAELLLGMVYFVGPEGGMRQSEFNLAEKYFWDARERKSPEAAYALALLFQQGGDEVPPKELGDAIIGAAAMGSPGGQAMLGTTRMKGLPPLIPRDSAESLKYLRLGAAGGSPDAFFSLGLMYEHGRVNEARPLIEAYRWLWRAARAPVVEPLDHPLNPSHWHRAKWEAKARQELASLEQKMMPQDLEAARRLAAAQDPAPSAPPK